MIKRFIRRVLGLADEQMQRVARGEHGLARAAISPTAAKVCAVLREAGFQAYVVGGAVRDLLLAIVPKDFDIATDARPEQVKPLFRRALIIGRRFRLVHVMMGAETVEVSTFRAADPDTAGTHERVPAAAARGRPAQGPAAASRRHPRAAARRALRDARARADRRTGARRAPGITGIPLRGAALARSARRVEGARSARRARHL